MTHILLVDDEPDLIWALRTGLCNEGYEMSYAYDGIEALAEVHYQRPDLIVLDLVMPRLDGLQFCRRLRQDPDLSNILILMLTVRSTVEERIKGLDTGADDYLVKPFDLRELKAHICALLRRRAQSDPKLDPLAGDMPPCIKVGPIVLDLHSCQIRVADGPPMQLTPIQSDLLHRMMLHPGCVFSSAQLIQQVWGCIPNAASSGLVRWHIKNLRSKIELDSAHPIYLRTVRHHGYVLSS